MDLYNIFHYFLSPDEVAECKKKEIPHYHWYYLQAINKGKGVIGIKELLKSRIDRSLFSNEELNIFANGIIRIIRKMARSPKAYIDFMGTSGLEKKFEEEIKSIYLGIIKKRKKGLKGNKRKSKLGIRKKVRTVYNITSCDDKEKLMPTLIFTGKASSDKDCMYYEDCDYFAKKIHNARLDCGYCPHQNIKK